MGRGGRGYKGQDLLFMPLNSSCSHDRQRSTSCLLPPETGRPLRSRLCPAHLSHPIVLRWIPRALTVPALSRHSVNVQETQRPDTQEGDAERAGM